MAHALKYGCYMNMYLTFHLNLNLNLAVLSCPSCSPAFPSFTNFIVELSHLQSFVSLFHLVHLTILIDPKFDLCRDVFAFSSCTFDNSDRGNHG